MISEVTAGASPHRAGGGAFWFRLTDNFFRRLGWWLLPVVTFTALGIIQAGNTVDVYRSGATLSAIENPLVESPTVLGASTQWWETPAVATSRIINEQLRTDSFVEGVAASAGLSDAIEQGLITLDIVRSNVWATANGDGILTVSATWDEPQTTYELVAGTIDGYETYISESVASDAAEAEEFFTQQLVTATAERDAVERELNSFLAENATDDSADEQPVSVQIQIDRLDARLDAAEAKVSAARGSIETAQLQVAQQTTRAGRTFNVIDQPSVPSAPVSTLIDRVTTIGSYLVLGLVVAGAGLLITTVLNRSITSAADLLAFDAVSLVATIPPIALPQAGSRRARFRPRRRGEAST